MDKEENKMNQSSSGNNKQKSHLYIFNLLTVRDGQDKLAMNLLSQFCTGGFNFGPNIFIFESEQTIDFLNQHIQKYVDTTFNYIFMEITDSIHPKTFKAFISKNSTPVSAELVNRLNLYKISQPKQRVKPLKSSQKEIDLILDKISKLGITALTPTEKQILDNF